MSESFTNEWIASKIYAALAKPNYNRRIPYKTARGILKQRILQDCTNLEFRRIMNEVEKSTGKILVTKNSIFLLENEYKPPSNLKMFV